MEKRKFGQIDTLRFFAVFGVVGVHWNWVGRQYLNVIDAGTRGVDLFFVISGFLITYGLILSRDKEASKGTSLYKFYIRRFLRIFPAYYLTLFLVYIFRHAEVADSIWWNVFYLVNFYSIKVQAWTGMGFAWSLSVEEQFYFIWPFLILFIPTRFLPAVMISSIILSLAAKSYWILSGFTFWTPYMHPLGSLDALALGALLSYLYVYHADRLRGVLFNPIAIAIIIVQLALFLALPKIGHGLALYQIGIRTSYGIFCAWLIGRSVFGFAGITGRVMDSPALRYIGQISYGIYLYHDFVPGILLGLDLERFGILAFIVYATATIGIASASYYLYERPFLRLKDRFE